MKIKIYDKIIGFSRNTDMEMKRNFQSQGLYHVWTLNMMVQY